MTREQIAHLKDLCDRATPGPWDIQVDGVNDWLYVAMERPPGGFFRYVSPATAADDAFINASREAIPALLAEVERLRALVKVAEFKGSADCGPHFEPACPWCDEPFAHRAECPAFHENGDAR